MILRGDIPDDQYIQEKLAERGLIDVNSNLNVRWCFDEVHMSYMDRLIGEGVVTSTVVDDGIEYEWNFGAGDNNDDIDTDDVKLPGTLKSDSSRIDDNESGTEMKMPGKMKADTTSHQKRKRKRLVTKKSPPKKRRF